MAGGQFPEPDRQAVGASACRESKPCSLHGAVLTDPAGLTTTPPPAAGIAIPASMHAQYLKAGEAGLRQLRTDVATFGRTWQYVRFMHCVTFIRNLKTRT